MNERTLLISLGGFAAEFYKKNRTNFLGLGLKQKVIINYPIYLCLFPLDCVEKPQRSLLPINRDKLCLRFSPCLTKKYFAKWNIYLLHFT